MKIIINNKFRKRAWIIGIAVVIIVGGALFTDFARSVSNEFYKTVDWITTIVCVVYGALASRLWREK